MSIKIANLAYNIILEKEIKIYRNNNKTKESTTADDENC